MASWSLQRLDGAEILSRPISEEAAEAALAVMARPAPPPAAVVVEAEAPPSEVVVRILVDLPPFVGVDMRTYTLKAGDLASVPPSVADLLVRRQKAVAA